MTRESTETNLPSSQKRFTLYPKMPSQEIKAFGIQGPMGEDFDDVKRLRCFLGLGSQDINGFYSVTYKLASDITDTIHLARLRGSPERTYTLAYPHLWYPGTFENYVANLIHEWQQTKDERLKMLTDALYTLGLTGRISAKRIGDISIQLQVGRLPHDRVGETDMVSVADMGFGVSQVLPVLVAVIAAEPGRLVYIEQPELHLHPPRTSCISTSIGRRGKTRCTRRRRNAQFATAFGGSNACCRGRPLTRVSQAPLVFTEQRWHNGG